MIVAADVHYRDDETATAAAVLFSDWGDAMPARELTQEIDAIEPYVPGQFYRRELPCLLALLDMIKVDINTIVVDGYVTLGADGKPGLGQILFERLDQVTPVIGVAKKRFLGTPSECELLRGESQTPLYIAAAGIGLEEAKAAIAVMHGPYRMPTLLKRVDQLCRRGV